MLLEKACARIAVLSRLDGWGLVRAFRRVAAQFRGRALGQGRRLRLSASTLRRLWYARSGVQRKAAFELHYRPRPKVEIPPELFRAMIDAALNEGLTVPGIYERFGGAERFKCSLATLFRIIPRRVAELARKRRGVQRVVILLDEEAARQRENIGGASCEAAKNTAIGGTAIGHPGLAGAAREG